MSSPTNSKNKRKADALGHSRPMGSGGGGDDDGRPAVIARLKDATSGVSDNFSSPTTAPHIPPPIWGRVLDFMPYEEVRSALLVGKIIANQAVKYVRVLNFTKSCQLDGPSARIFASVEEVNCLCLFSGQYGRAVLCKDSTIRLVPLLTVFTKIKRIDVRGLVTRRRNDQEQLVRPYYNRRMCSSPENHRELAEAFVRSFLGAFKTRLLPSSLAVSSILGIFANLPNLCSGRGDDNENNGMCETCAEVSSFFPLQEIVEHPYCFPCVKEIDVYEKVSKRKGARELFRKDSDDYLSEFLEGCFKEFPIEDGPKEKVELRRRLAKFGVEWGDSGNKGIWYLTMSDIECIDRLIAVGFDPRTVPKNTFYGILGILSIANDDRQYDIYAKSTFDALVARGFAFDEADLIVLDERMEPALKDLPALIRKGETG